MPLEALYSRLDGGGSPATDSNKKGPALLPGLRFQAVGFPLSRE